MSCFTALVVRFHLVQSNVSCCDECNILYGHVAERFNAPYLKYDVLRYHEFESHPVRPNGKILRRLILYLIYRNHM